MNEAPVVQYMILCNDVRIEGSNPKRLNVYGLMTQLESPGGAFPAPVPEFCVLLALRNGRGHGSATLSALNEDTGSACWNSVTLPINFGPNPLETRWLSFRVSDVTFPNAGVYAVEFRYNGAVLASQSLIVTGKGFMKELFHVFGPDELFGADEAWGFEVQAIPCQPDDDPRSTKGMLEIESCDSLTELDTRTQDGGAPDRPAA
jgi:hypothetical protein